MSELLQEDKKLKIPISFGDEGAKMITKAKFHDKAVVVEVDFGTHIEESSITVPDAGKDKKILEKSVR